MITDFIPEVNVKNEFLYPYLFCVCELVWVLCEEDEDVILSYISDGHNKQVTYILYCDGYFV